MANKNNTHIVLLMLFCISTLFTSNASSLSKNVSGVAKMTLNSPVNPQLRKQQRKIAQNDLINSINKRITELLPPDFDRKNPVSKYLLDKFYASCIQNAKESSSMDKHIWTLDYTLPISTMDSIIVAHNTYNDAQAFHFMEIITQSQKNNLETTIFNAGINVLFYAIAHFGEPLMAPDIQPAKTLIQYIRPIVQNILDRININFNSPIITGKPANKPQNEINITVLLDTVPFPNFALSASLPDGKKLISLKTDNNGNAPLSELKTPFVIHGTFLHIKPDFSTFTEASFSFDIKSLGLNIQENIDQTLIFNIVKPVYILDFKTTSVSKMEIPPDFSSSKAIEKFLCDSCSLQPKTGIKQTDLSIKIYCQVSSYSYDEKEITTMKVESHSIIKELKQGGSEVERTVILNEKNYDINHEIPIGLFFWESLKALQVLIKQMLDEL